MYSKNNKKMNDQKHLEKVNQYGIKKFNVGTASVLVAAGFAFLGGGNALASNDTAVNNANEPATPAATATAKEETPAPTVAKANKANLSAAIARVQNAIAKAGVTEKTSSAIEEGKAELANAQALEASETATQGEVDKATVALKNRAFVLESMPKATADKKEEKVNKNQDSRNGQAIPGKGESGFRDGAATANPIIPAAEGPTNNNKLGSGNNPADGVFESAKNQFGDIDFDNATEKSKEVKKQWSRSTASQGGNTEILGSLTYNWKEKEITAAEANNNNALNGWKIESGEKVTAVKPEAPTNVSANRPAGFDPKPSKVYDLDGKVPQRDNEVESPGHPLGVNAANQSYANGVNYSGMVGTHNLPKGYYLELGKQGTKISKEYAVNGNSRVMLSAITGGAYGNAGTAGTGEKVKITVKDDKGNVIASIRDDRTIGEKFEESHISAPTGDGGNGDGWTEYRAIYEIPKDVTKIKVEIEALNDGTAINNSYLQGTNSKVTDGYFVGAVNLAVGTGVEMTTNVKSNKAQGKFGEDNLYKSNQTGEFEFTVNSVGGTRLYGSAETEIEVPEGVELPNNITNPTGWVWFGNTPVAPNNIQWDPATRKLRLKYNTSKSNNGDSPYIGVGSNGGKNDGERRFRLPFTTKDNYKGTATFKVRTFLPNGLRDAEDNAALNTGDVSNANGKYHPVVSGVRNTDQPDYYYNKTIYIDTVKPQAPTVEAVHTDRITGEKTDKNQPTELLISVPAEKDPNLTDEAREKQDIAANDKNNGTNRVPDTEVDNIKKAIGGLTTMKVTLPNSKTPITLTKKADGWYNGATKVEVRDGKLVVPVPAGTDLTEANETTNPDKRIKVTVLDKAGNESDPAYGDVINNAPTVETKKKDIYVYKTPADKKLTADEVLKKSEATATDLEDDRDGVDSTKPTIAVSNEGGLDSTKPGDYTVRVQATDSEGKKSNIDTTTVHVLDLITVDPTVTADPANPSTTAPVSPKTADTPVKPGDENYGKYPAGVSRDDLVKEVTRTIKYIDQAEKDNPNAPAIDEDAPERVQKVTYKRTATVNPETGEVTYSDWTVYEGAGNLSDASVDGTKGKFNSADSPVVEGYLQVEPTDKTIPEKEAPTPSKTGEVTNEVVKVLYKEIGSFKVTYPEGKKPKGAEDKIHYPNDPNDSTKIGDFGKITIPYVEGFVPSYNGKELTPVDPNNPSKGYKIPEDFKPTDNFGETPITYVAGEQKATVKFVSVDKDGTETPLDKKYDITDLKGKAGEKIPEEKIQARLDVLRTMGYEVKENPFDKDPKFDTTADTDTEISQNFVVKLTPKVSTPTPVYVVEGDKPTADKLKGAVTTEGNEKTVDETKIPETKGKVGDETLTVPVTVTYGSGDNKREETVNVPVKVVKGYPQIVPVDPKTAPKAEDSINPDDYPAGSKFTYEKEPDTSSTGDKDVKVIVTDKDGNELVKVPAIVRVVDSTPQFVVADPKKPQPDVKQSITPDEYPEGTKFEYKEPVDTTTSGEKDVVVVAKLNGNTIVEVPAKVMVVDPKTQYVFEDPKKPQPDASESIDPEQYPEGTKFTYKDGEVDTTTPGDKKVTVVAKDGEDKLVEVPAVVKVLPLVKPEGLTVLKGSDNLEAAVKAKAEEVVAALPKDKLPEGVTVKVKEVKAGTTPTTAEVTETGKPKPATVVIEYTDDKGNVIGTKEVEVPVTVVGSTPKPVVVFEGEKPTKAKDAVTPGQGGTVGEPTTLPDTKGKAGATDVTVEVPVTYEGIKDPEKVTVPVTVLPVAKGDVTVAKNTTPDKLKELAKAKAKEAVEAKDFTGKLPKDATVTVGDVTEEVLAKLTAEKGTNTGTVNVPVTYKIPGDDTPYTTTIPVTVNVKGSDIKPVYVVEGDKPKADDVNKAIIPDKDGTATPVTDEDINKAIPTTEGKVGDKDVKVTTKVTYKDGGEETVEVPVTVLPKVKPEGVVVPKNSDKTELEKAIKEEAEKAAKNVKGLPEGVTVTVTNVETNTVPGTENVGKQTPAKVKVKYTDKDGNEITKVIEVPVNVVEAVPTPIETPVTKTPLTPEDYTKGIKIPEGGKVTNVENLPDLTTPGKKDPVKVTVTLPNGKTITVEVPVNVTPVKEIETPVTKTPLTPEDYTKGIKIPEGGKVTNVENIPDLTTPGKKDPVKVTVELPNGKVITVEVPVTVTPINEIIKNVGDPITNDDVEKNVKIPEGGKIVSIGNKPGTETPGVKPTVPVVIELPNGKQITVEVPVIVKPKVTPVVVKVGTPITEEDVKKHVDLPEGWKVTKVGEIPTTATPGEKTSVPVEVELPDGRKITVEVPVIVTPKVSTIIVPQGTVITPEDVKNHIDLPKEPGWEIVEVGEIPSTVPAGVKPSVKVKVKLPNGRVIDLEVPVISTPKVTPIVVEVGTPITKEDVKKHVELPKESGWEIVEVGEIPTTETPGEKTAVKVKVKLPSGEIIELEVPVTVTPKHVEPSTPAGPTTPEQPQGENGNKPQPETPAKPAKPSENTKPEAPKAPVAKAGEKVLPNTGIADNNSALAGLGLAIFGLAAAARRRKQK